MLIMTGQRERKIGLNGLNKILKACSGNESIFKPLAIISKVFAGSVLNKIQYWR